MPLAVLFCLPSVRAAHQRRPFAVAVAALSAGLVIRFDILFDVTTTRTMSRPHEIFWLFALGWAAAAASTRDHRVLVTAVAVLAVPGFFGSAARKLAVIAGVLAVTWVSTIVVPRPAGRLIGWVAGGSRYIYLTHFQVYPPLARLGGPAFAVAGSLLAGIALWLVAHRLVDAGQPRTTCTCPQEAEAVTPDKANPR